MNEYIGPVQPFTGAMAQENFGQMIDHVISWNSKIPSQLVKRRINLHLREIQALRTWAGLFVRGEFIIHAAYTTGTIAATPGSDVITGTATAWPYRDSVNTTLSVAVTVANELQDMTPALMTNIEMGGWILIGEGTANEEFVLVHSVTSTTFQAKPTKVHSAGEVITKSSYIGRAMRVGYRKSMYPIIGITSDQRMKIDCPYSHDAETAQTYQIVEPYITMPPGLKVVWSIVNMNQGWALKAYLPQEVVQRYDAWRAAQGWPSLMLNFTPDHIGRIRYELYPTPTVSQSIPFIASRIIPNLTDDEDCPPTCIPSGIIVNHTLADALLHDRKSEYYDPTASREFRNQAQIAMNGAILDDDNVYMQNLEWMISRYNLVAPGSDFWQSHDEGYFL